jgi:hypothetical protein
VDAGMLEEIAAELDEEAAKIYSKTPLGRR